MGGKPKIIQVMDDHFSIETHGFRDLHFRQHPIIYSPFPLVLNSTLEAMV